MALTCHMRNVLVLIVPVSSSGNMNSMDKADSVPCCNMKVIFITQEFEMCFILQFQVSERFFFWT
jgi:hypothetical protein